MVIDFHTHIFPDKLAPRALEKLAAKSGGIRPLFDGTPVGLVRHMRQHKTDLSVALNIATNAGQQKAVNDFAIEVNNGPIIAFGSVYPFAPDAAAELERLARAGVKGVKFHPEYQNFYVDDERVLPLYDKIAELGLITVFHPGADIGHPKPIHCAPKRLARILRRFRGAPVVAAHFGGYIYWDEVEICLAGQDVYFDTSFCHTRIPVYQAEALVRRHGASRVLYGSDLPWSDDDGEKLLVEHLNISDEERALVFGGNAARLLGLT